jgi:hypothetical protein
LHVDLAEAGDAARELEECLNAFKDTHVCEADLLPDSLVQSMIGWCAMAYLDEL